MNTVILNGVSSNTIQGLLIQSLPPISKPLIRTQIDEIDGRDGDIVTKLGYAAYNRAMTIGLHGNFDIDDVIKFFDSEGTAVFSNEPDKVYHYSVLEQIDYERLIRFRTATVNFHVQPFKFLLDEQPITSTARTVTVTNNGNVTAKPAVTITGSGNISLSLNGNQIFQISDLSGSITIDAAAMEAYDGGILKNRQVVGDYDNLELNIGSNTITTSGGTLTRITIANYSRWI